MGWRQRQSLTVAAQCRLSVQTTGQAPRKQLSKELNLVERRHVTRHTVTSEMVVALACPITLPLARPVSPGPESDTTSHSSVESVIEQEALKQSSHKNGRIMFLFSSIVIHWTNIYTWQSSHHSQKKMDLFSKLENPRVTEQPDTQ